MAASGRRVMTYLKSSQNVAPVTAKFSQCIVDILNNHSNSEDNSVNVNCELKGDNLILMKSESSDLVLRHPPMCPLRHFKPDETVNDSGVRIGVVAVLESSDNRVLITRRAAHMRTFPGVWVPPGGGIDPGESLLEASIRELQEETGLILNEANSRSHTLCLWESVFPPIIEWGDPRRHHVVIYFHIKVNETHTEMDEKIQLQPEEVDASIWLDQTKAELVVFGIDKDELPQGMEKTFKMKVLDPDTKTMSDVDCPTEMLMAKVPLKGNVDVQRVSSGTKFALHQWLEKCSKQNCKL